MKQVRTVVCFPLPGSVLNVGLTTILSLSATATYDFLAFEDASKDKVMDVLFVLRNTEGSQNNTCADAGIKCSSF